MKVYLEASDKLKFPLLHKSDKCGPVSDSVHQRSRIANSRGEEKRPGEGDCGLFSGGERWSMKR